MMTPDKLRTLSRRTFKATIYSGVGGIFLAVAGIPSVGSGNTTILVIFISGFSLLGIAMLCNIVSLVSGAIAWRKGAGRCGWIVISALLLLIPVALLLVALL